MDLEYLGHRLLERGFSDWFRYIFRTIEGRPFVMENLHNDLFDVFEKMYSGDITRQIINIPPRSAKTTIAKYYIAYCWTRNPKANFIYTSYSQSLLGTIAREMAQILEHPAYKALYPATTSRLEKEETDPVDEFWGEYLYQDTGKNIYTNNKITTYAGGVCLLSSIGAQITGYGAGIRNCDGFSGALIIDDPNKPADIRSSVLREKVVRYFEETLLSRLNAPNVPILTIQQRLHLEDLSGVLLKKYNFNLLKRALIDENGVCQLPSQYTEDRIKELQINNYMFTSQYQQEPITAGGEVFHKEWWKFYDPSDRGISYGRCYITADTAMKTGERNDFTAIGVHGVTRDGEIHLLDMVHGKFEAPDLEKVFLMMWNKWKYPAESRIPPCSAVLVEDKASGIGLIQGIRQKGVPVTPIQATRDKYTRALEAVPTIAAGLYKLPKDEMHPISQLVIKEAEEFTSEMTHLHDDILDMLFYGIENAKRPMGFI